MGVIRSDSKGSGQEGSPPGNGSSDADLFQVSSDRGRDAIYRGDFKTALDEYLQAKEHALEQGDSYKKDTADLNIAMVYLQMGHARKGQDGLREILLRSPDPRMAFFAAYNIGMSMRKQGKFDRAVTYASRAMDQAKTLDSADKKARVHNLLGNIYLNQTFLPEAFAEYSTALSIRESQDEDTIYSRAILLENIGYCLLLMKKFDAGISRIKHALELAEQVGDHRCRAECLQDLCYGYLLLDDYGQAIEIGCQALEEAIESEYPDIIENCHYLLGELGSKTGNTHQRDEHFQHLQDLHPELPFLKEFLCTVDVTNIITLKR